MTEPDTGERRKVRAGVAEGVKTLDRLLGEALVAIQNVSALLDSQEDEDDDDGGS